MSLQSLIYKKVYAGYRTEKNGKNGENAIEIFRQCNKF